MTRALYEKRPKAPFGRLIWHESFVVATASPTG